MHPLLLNFYYPFYFWSYRKAQSHAKGLFSRSNYYKYDFKVIITKTNIFIINDNLRLDQIVYIYINMKKYINKEHFVILYTVFV